MEITVHAKRAEPLCNPCIFFEISQVSRLQESITLLFYQNVLTRLSAHRCKVSANREKNKINSFIFYPEVQPNFFLAKQDKVTARQLKKQHLRLVFLSRGVSFLLLYSPNNLQLFPQKLKYPRIRNEISMDT